MPLVGTLIILPVKTEYTFKGPVAEPEPSGFAEQESLNEGGNMMFECSVRESRLESTASQ
jgi:hypothetical protein